VPNWKDPTHPGLAAEITRQLADPDGVVRKTPLQVAANMLDRMGVALKSLRQMIYDLERMQHSYTQLGFTAPVESHETIDDLTTAADHLTSQIEHLEACVNLAS
jgi:hypothetical protein